MCFTKVVISALLVTLLPASFALAETRRPESRDRIEGRFDRCERIVEIDAKTGVTCAKISATHATSAADAT